MSDSNTTSIHDLPTDPMGANNISLITSEKSNMNAAVIDDQRSMSLDQSTINQIVNGLQQASATGATMLPSRDISLNTHSLTQDATIKPNYVPPPNNVDYINDSLDPEQYISQYQRDEQMKDSLDNIYDEFQTPFLLGILYFLFQLPIFKKILFKYIPFLCHTDGNYNLNGLIFSSSLFGFLYYFLSKTMKQFNTF
jgi:hypothetical protein